MPEQLGARPLAGPEDVADYPGRSFGHDRVPLVAHEFDREVASRASSPSRDELESKNALIRRGRDAAHAVRSRKVIRRRIYGGAEKRVSSDGVQSPQEGLVSKKQYQIAFSTVEPQSSQAGSREPRVQLLGDAMDQERVPSDGHCSK